MGAFEGWRLGWFKQLRRFRRRRSGQASIAPFDTLVDELYLRTQNSERNGEIIIFEPKFIV
jgi:hypothetical protein